MEFIVNNYIWFIIIGGVSLLINIGYIADKTNFGKNKFNANSTEKYNLAEPIANINNQPINIVEDNIKIKDMVDFQGNNTSGQLTKLKDNFNQPVVAPNTNNPINQSAPVLDSSLNNATTQPMPNINLNNFHSQSNNDANQINQEVPNINLNNSNTTTSTPTTIDTNLNNFSNQSIPEVNPNNLNNETIKSGEDIWKF